MSHLLIRFDSDALEAFHYAMPADSDLLVGIQWQAAEAESLKETCAGHSVIFLLPQQAVLTTALDLPEKASRQLMTAIDFQVEDRLAQDIESQHVAIGDTSLSPLPVAVVSRGIMERCLALVDEAAIRLHSILPEYYLCPFESGVIRFTEIDGQWLLRTGPHRALKTERASLPIMLELLARETEVRVLAGETESEALELPEGWQQEILSSSATVASLLDKSVINLLQRDYRLTSPWLSLLHTWRWAALFLVGLIVVTGYNQWTVLHQLESEVATVKAQQYQVVRAYLPDSTSPDDNLKTLLIRELSSQQGLAADQGFLSGLQRFSKAKAAYPQINVDRITFQRDTLRVDLLANQLNQIEDLLQTIKRTDSAASLTDLSVKPGEVSATLVIAGGDDD